jgi:hypothetical protein
MSSNEQASDHISATVSGTVSGQVAVGKDIAQHQVTTTMGVRLSDAELTELHDAFSQLKRDVAAAVPDAERGAALERIDELQEAVTAAEPDLNTVQYVKQWFARKLPVVAGVVASILIHPLVGRLIERTGDAAADAMFGRPQDSTHD